MRKNIFKILPIFILMVLIFIQNFTSRIVDRKNFKLVPRDLQSEIVTERKWRNDVPKISTDIPQKTYKIHDTPASTRKSYMPYQSITSITSDQYKLQKLAYTNKYGIRKVKGRYCIAVGSAYSTQIGTYIDLILENKHVIHCILADCKSDQHTDTKNILSKDGSLVEFIVDISKIKKNVKLSGDVSDTREDWDSAIVKIKIYEEKENF